ncbi:hypothetical protein BDZ97DRAFT_1824445 [Flammula alnicola]|nr:hypothetical protein BDZ97DRAFT_1824445 [Flammula alnicola]
MGAMYFEGKDVKSKEGHASPYAIHHGQGIGGGDKSMTSSDVSAAVSVPKPHHERLHLLKPT